MPETDKPAAKKHKRRMILPQMDADERKWGPNFNHGWARMHTDVGGILPRENAKSTKKNLPAEHAAAETERTADLQWNHLEGRRMLDEASVFFPFLRHSACSAGKVCFPQSSERFAPRF